MNTIQLQEEALSEREFEVLELLARGHQNRQIAITLSIKERTVRFHVENILNKLGVRSRTEAVCHAFRNGWIND